MSYLEIPAIIPKPAKISYRLVGPSNTKPEPAEGNLIDDQPVQFEGVTGKYWIEYNITETE